MTRRRRLGRQIYQQFDFAELPGYPMRLYLPFKLLERMAKGRA